jgi:hypothetical protein
VSLGSPGTADGSDRLFCITSPEGSAVGELLVVSSPPDRWRRYMGQMYLFQELA